MLRELIGLSGSEINEISDAFDFVGNEYHCYNGMTPLMIAAKRNRNDLVTELLVNQQIDKNVQNEKGQKALDFANDQTLRDLFGLNQNK
jgi:ankyrin repeat protein